MGKIKRRATRDLFTICLDLDMIAFKLDNLLEDLDNDSHQKEWLSILEIRDHLSELRNQANGVRIIWEKEKRGGALK